MLLGEGQLARLCRLFCNAQEAHTSGSADIICALTVLVSSQRRLDAKIALNFRSARSPGSLPFPSPSPVSRRIALIPQDD
eukprot:SAG11_NODE_4222_length_2004_cov_1.156955_1_plen_79_part_10